MKLIVEENLKDLFSQENIKTQKVFDINISKLGAKLNNGVIFACDLNKKDLTVTINLLTKLGEQSYESYFEKTLKIGESFEYIDECSDWYNKTKFILEN